MSQDPQYDIYNQSVGDTYQYLLQVRDQDIYTGDGYKVDFINVDTPTNFPVSVTETITLSSPSQYLLPLEFTPDLTQPLSVVWNGLWLHQGVSSDYTIVQDSIEINPEHILEPGDVFVITYYKQ